MTTFLSPSLAETSLKLERDSNSRPLKTEWSHSMADRKAEVFFCRVLTYNRACVGFFCRSSGGAEMKNWPHCARRQRKGWGGKAGKNLCLPEGLELIQR